MKGSEKKILRSKSHHLKPVINIGKNGITEAQIKKIDDTIKVKELIKIKILKNAPLDSREKLLNAVNELGCELIQEKGKIFTIFREKPTDEN